jgi:hypothetical protein
MGDSVIEERFFEVSYLYRDAANFKCRGSFVVKGPLSLGELTPYLIEEEHFIPELVGIPSLTPDHWTELDHEYHEIEAIEPTEPGPFAFTAAQFITRMKHQGAREWRR